jgi:membrane protease YdiL (CAAX protease family)
MIHSQAQPSETESAVVTLVLALVAGYSLGPVAVVPLWSLAVLLGATVIATFVPRLRVHLPAAGACLGLVSGALLAIIVVPALRLSGPAQAGIFKLVWAAALAFACLATGGITGDLLPELGSISRRGWLGALVTFGLLAASYWWYFRLPASPLLPAGWALVAGAVHRALAAGVMDEYIFRGLLLGRFLAANRALYALLAQATVYAFLHMGFVAPGMGGFVLAFLLAMVTGYSVVRTKGVGWAFLVHGAYAAFMYLV